MLGRAALKPPPSDAEIGDLCKVNASRNDSEQLTLESNLLDMALDRGFLATMRSVFGLLHQLLPSGTTLRD